MQDLFDQLHTGSFDDYAVTLTQVRARLQEGGEKYTLRPSDLIFVLRPYMWWLHFPGFEDVMSKAEAAAQTLMAHEITLDGGPPRFPGSPMIALGTFLVRYIQDGLFDPTGFAALYASAETQAAFIAETFAAKLAAKGIDGEALLTFAALMKAIEAAKRESHRILRQIGDQRLDELATYIHDLPEKDQDLVLRALDDFAGNPGVIAFYEAFIEATIDDDLREAATGCLESVRG